MTSSPVPGPALYDLIHQLASQHQFSDLLFKEGSVPRMRIHGLVKSVGKDVAPPMTREHFRAFFKRMEASTGFPASKVDNLIAEHGDRDFAVKIGRHVYRGNIFLATQRLSMALRRLPSEIPALASLGLPPSFLTMVQQSKGLLLVTGATGSGKTTTLASALQHLNKSREGHIITLEDPIEYHIKDEKCVVDQREIGRDATSFKEGLRSALRQDPDIILVGELRDHDTVKTALDAANTGHLVLGTLHTNSAQQSVERLTSFFSADKRDWAQATISQVLIGIVSQVLVPRKDGTGRVLAAEVLVGTQDVKLAIRENRSHQILHALDTGSSRGQVQLKNVLKDLVQRGIISAEDALFYTYDPNQLAKELKIA